MAVDAKAGTYPCLTVARPAADEYERQRRADAGMLRRDVGRALGESAFGLFPATVVDRMSLDSEILRETWAQRFLRELEAAGYVVTFRGRGA